MGLIVYNVNEEYEEQRIDRFLAEQSEDLTRSYIQKLIKDGRLLVNDKQVRASYQVHGNDRICLDVPPSQEPEILPEPMDLDILFEDSDIIVVNKPKGMVVHPAAGHYSGTLVNALMYHCKDLSGINGILRPGIVHRIDKDTSGVLVCAKSDAAHKNLAEQFKAHSITRKYRAICIGALKDLTGTIDAPIGRNPNDRKLMAINDRNGKHAVTHYQILSQTQKYSYIECQLETGRTHQIRVHMASKHHPLLGDTIYGGKLSEYKLHGHPLDGQVLHAKTLGFVHPITGKMMEFDTELPAYFLELIDILFSKL